MRGKFLNLRVDYDSRRRKWNNNIRHKSFFHKKIKLRNTSYKEYISWIPKIEDVKNQKKPAVEKQTNVNQTTNVEFNPLKVQGEVNFNLKNTDGSITKLSQDQINQLLNSSEFQKTIENMFKDMQARGNYANMPSKSGG